MNENNYKNAKNKQWTQKHMNEKKQMNDTHI